MAVDLVTVVGWATVLVTFVMMGSGIPACLNMITKKRTDNVPYFMFLIFVFVTQHWLYLRPIFKYWAIIKDVLVLLLHACLIYSGLLGLQYGLLIENNTLAFINFTSVVVWGAYAGVYLFVTQQKSQALKQMLLMLVLYFAHYMYLVYSPQSEITETMGTFMLFWCSILNVLPAIDFVTIFKEKSTNCCDISMLFGGTLCGVVWCLYGYLEKNFNIYFPSIPGLLICMLKFALIAYYGKSSKKVD